MKYGIFSDIHSNLEALEAVLSVCKQRGVDQYLCLGDIVGYGPNPNECIDLVRNICSICVAGNHDWATTGKLDVTYFTPDGKEAAAWTTGQFTSEGFDYLSNLPIVERTADLILVHGTLSEPEMFRYQNNIEKMPESFSLMDRRICFIGHTHSPKVLIQQKEKIDISSDLKFKIEEDLKYIVNVGSVGQSRDGIPLAAVCFYDTDTGVVEIKRVKYDIEAVQTKIIEVGLPEMLAYRLSVGM